MKRLIILIGLLGFAIQGCAADRIATMANQTRSDAFATFAEGGALPDPGAAELHITCSFKAPARQVAEHASRERMLLLNIDGQILEISARPTTAVSSTIYSFATKIRLGSGSHRIFAALPEEGAYADRTVILKGGSRNTLLLMPLYRRRTLGSARGLDNYSFEEGVRGFEVFLNRDQVLRRFLLI